MSEETKSEAALRYAGVFGWHIHPLHGVDEGRCTCGDGDCGTRAGKHPRTPHGLKDATDHPDLLDEWWQRWPDANVGVRTGPESGVFVVGPDGEQGIADLAALEAKHGPLPPTATAMTGSGGRHLLFRWPTAGSIPNRRNHRGSKIDVRGDGGYIVAAPSTNSNGPYRWLQDPADGIAEAPEWLLVWARGDGRVQAEPQAQRSWTQNAGSDCDRRIDRAVKYLDRCPHSVSEAGGHAAAMWAARVVVYGFDLGTDVGYRVLADHFNPRCQPPWNEKELRHKVEEADSKPFDKPRGWLLETPPERNGRSTADDTHHPPPDDFAAEPDVADDEAHLTDVGNAKRFVADHVDDVKYCPALGWLVWDGRRWKRDEAKAVQELAKETIARLYREAAALVAEMAAEVQEAGDDASDEQKARHKAAKKMLDWALKSEDAHRIANLLTLALSDAEVVVNAGQLDRDHFAFNVRNGTIDLRAGQLRPHDRADLITRLADVDFAPGPCPAWESFLASVFPGDAELVKWLRRLCGYSLTGDVREQIVVILHGSGSNGKSVFCEALLDLLGDYGLKANAELLLAGKTDRHETEKAQLAGRRFVAAVETGEGRKLNETLVKELSGGDRVRARFMRMDHFEFASTFKLVIGTNHKPEIRGTDLGIWRRIRLVPFNARFWKPGEPEGNPKMRADPQMKERLQAEYPAILAWMVTGAVEWSAAGLGTCRAVDASTAEYRSDEDKVALFVDDECHREGEVKAADLYRRYKEWAVDRNEPAMTQTMFGTKVVGMGFEKAKNSVTLYRGLSLRARPTPMFGGAGG